MKRFYQSMLRRIRLHALFSAINFGGLVLGFTCIIIIAFWIKTETGYDRFHNNLHSIYRVHRYFYDENGAENLHLPNVAAVIAPLLKSEFTEISHIARMYHTGIELSADHQKMPEAAVCFAEPDVLKIFSFEGLPADTSLLIRPFTAIISQETAEKYFPNEPAFGKMLEFADDSGNMQVVEITGVFHTWKRNSHFRPGVLISFSTYESLRPKEELLDWSSNNYETYVMMSSLPAEVDKRLDAFIDKNLDHGTSYTKIRFESLADIHFNWFSNRAYVFILFTIALLILILAGINFMNLNTAIYVKQIRDLSIKKIIGASKKTLIVQMLSESVVFCIAAFLTALYLAYLVLPGFNSILNHPIDPFFNDPILVSGFLLLAILTGMASGLYPAWMIMGIRPGFRNAPLLVKNSRSSFRNGLVVFQFVVSATLLISMLFVSKQLNFLRNNDLGLDKENVVIIPATPQLIEKLDVFKQQVTSNPSVLAVTASKRIPSEGLWDANGARIISGNTPIPLGFRLANVRIDENFLQVYKIPLVAGRNFHENIQDDFGFLLNESAVQQIGWKSNAEALNQIIEYGGVRGNVIGVVKDFHYESLRNPITPIIMYYSPADFNLVSIRVAPGDLKPTLDFIERTWQTYNNVNSTYFYEFLADRYRNLYKAEENIRNIFLFCLVLALSIAVLGLIGLSVFLIERRTKEIGIRKVNGAGVAEILVFLNRDFLTWVGMALVISCPIAWFAMHRWLQNFAYKTHLSWWVFALAFLTVLLVAMLTVSLQSWRAAVRNPVDSLRYE